MFESVQLHFSSVREKILTIWNYMYRLYQFQVIFFNQGTMKYVSGVCKMYFLSPEYN